MRGSSQARVWRSAAITASPSVRRPVNGALAGAARRVDRRVDPGEHRDPHRLGVGSGGRHLGEPQPVLRQGAQERCGRCAAPAELQVIGAELVDRDPEQGRALQVAAFGPRHQGDDQQQGRPDGAPARPHAGSVAGARRSRSSGRGGGGGPHGAQALERGPCAQGGGRVSGSGWRGSSEGWGALRPRPGTGRAW